MATLIDTNVLVYRVDHRFPEKRDRATDVLRAAIASGDARVPYQAIVEFVAATTRLRSGQPPMLERTAALREAEELLACYDVIWPDEAMVRLACGALPAQLVRCADLGARRARGLRVDPVRRLREWSAIRTRASAEPVPLRSLHGLGRRAAEAGGHGHRRRLGGQRHVISHNELLRRIRIRTSSSALVGCRASVRSRSAFRAPSPIAIANV